jgi:hypothetical protein
VTWYFSDLARYRAERANLDSLALEADWFVPVRWRTDDKIRLVLDAEISAGGRTYPVSLRYPSLFPHTPPSVIPRGNSSRWSQHQFGAGGELCLEYGPDNWTPDFTGAHLIESTHRLLDGENPQSGERGVVRSRHQVSLGQKIRSEFGRLLLTRATERFLTTIRAGVELTGSMVIASHMESIVYVINKITQSDGTSWTDSSVPAQLREEYYERPVTIYRIDASQTLPPTNSLQIFRAACRELGLCLEQPYLVILQGAKTHLYLPWDEKDSVFEIAIVPAEIEVPRLSEFHQVLKEKRVALIGCGSLGSKIGVILARCGVGHFLLIDDDLLCPDNLVRNDLDWRDIGTHKAAAVARRMQLVNPHVQTQKRQVRLAGQESSETAETLLNSIGECDLVFDATANPDVLNLTSALASVSNVPVLWAEVFGGGIGGLIARCRPGIEPSPQYMRWAIENWFDQRGSPPARPKRRYDADGDGTTLIADDADVTAIASHAARFAIDTLIPRDPSLFPSSVYAIGLGVGSVFSQPFETFPIGVGAPPSATPAEQLSQEEAAAEIATILELLKARTNEAATPTADH